MGKTVKLNDDNIRIIFLMSENCIEMLKLDLFRTDRLRMDERKSIESLIRNIEK